MDDIELFMNEIQADVQVFQLVLQEFLANSLNVSANPKQILSELQRGIRKNAGTSANISADPKDGERLRLLTLARCDRFFAPLNRIFGVSLADTPPAGKTN
jgi:hypothetical protein